MLKRANFRNDLKYSISKDKLWSVVYEKYFGKNYLFMSDTISNIQAQHKGIDRIIYLTDGQTIGIDEKLQRKSWNTFLLEYNSNDTTPGHNGWINKDLSIDYMVYGFESTRLFYFLVWKELKTVWEKYKNVWLKEFEHIKAPNKGYNTWSLAIPINYLRNIIYIEKVNV